MVPHLPSRLPGLLVVLAVLCLFAGGASAGPWPREKGDLFLSFSHETASEAGSDAAGWTSLYAEYGLTPRWTVGLDLGSGGDTQIGMIFVQRAVGRQDGPGRLAFSSGVGLQTGAAPQAFGMMGAAWGRSLGTPLGPGWVAVEPQLRMGVALTDEWPPTLVLDVDGTLLTTASTKLDLTLGATLRPKLIVMGQLQMERVVEGETTARLTASAVRDVGRRGKLQLGVSAPVQGKGDAALKLGTWLEF
ncbi:hypothetical protein GVY41_19275 [Frigidibacter albus]|uniref:Uncharacterized protein n=1 Tax=Frigidibacter albus TaxID=1465486 RepID=A0A6L8VMA7_9RHOB|nr:hypothetical protein [Frigidibacter albus]MZQ91214.1 hypothetical protein [Frigidibacter albus]NBE33141.1 hypothetical protein [Frigidibacter albus]GGH63531.1 hypothetical protein GCM10011341_38730 [Frigidibacter albus]